MSLGVGAAALAAVAGRVRCRSGHAGANRRSGAGGGRRVRRESHLRWHSSSCCWRLLRGLIHGLRLRLRRPGRIRTAAASNACSRSAHIGADRRRGVGGGHGACHLGLVLLRWSRWRRLLLLWSLVLLRTERRRNHHQHQHSQASSSPLLSPPCWMAVALVVAAAVRHCRLATNAVANEYDDVLLLLPLPAAVFKTGCCCIG